MVTSNKILEVRFHPLSSNIIYTVLLDQIKCTEVDVRTDGIINHLLNMGDIILTFDRPTKRDSFTFSNIHGYCDVGAYLREILINPSDPSLTSPAWYASHDENEKARFIEEYT